MPSYTVVFPDKMRVVQNVGRDADKIAFTSDYMFSAAIPGSFIRDCAMSELRRKYADELRKLPVSARHARASQLRELDVYRKWVKKETSLAELLSETEGMLQSADATERQEAKAKLERIQALLEKMEDEEEEDESEDEA